MFRKALSYTMIVVLLMMLTACGSKNPHFIGYVYSKDTQNGHTVVVGVSDGSSSYTDVLIRKGVSKLDIGSKVEVYYSDNEINAIFPANARAKLTEIKAAKEEKAMLKNLFTHIYNENGKNVYPSVIHTEDHEHFWNVEVKLISVGSESEGDMLIAYSVAKDGSAIERIYE